MRRNADLTRVTCSGIVDGDDYEKEDEQRLNDLGIIVLSVAEIENLFLLPRASRAIAEAEGFAGDQLDGKLYALTEAIFKPLDNANKIEAVVVRHSKRRIDRMMKKIDLSSANTVEELRAEYDARTNDLDVEGIASARFEVIHKAVAERDLSTLLAVYDNKEELLALAASHLKGCSKDRFKGWITRSLMNNSCPQLTEALSEFLPAIEPK